MPRVTEIGPSEQSALGSMLCVSGTDRKHGTMNSQEVIGVDQAGRCTDVAEAPDNKINADDQITIELALHSETHVYSGWVRDLRTNHGTLFVDFDISDRDVSVVWIAPHL